MPRTPGAGRPGPPRAAPRTGTGYGPGSCWTPLQAASNAVIARQVGVGVDTVRKWRKRFAAGPVGGARRPTPAPGPPAARCRTPCGPRWSRWRVSCRPTRGCRCPGGAARRLARELALRCQVRVSASIGAPLAGRRRAQAVAAPVLDLDPGPRLRGQGRPRAGPVRRDLGRPAVGPERLRDLRGREDLHPGPLPLPPHPGPRAGPGDAGRARLPAAAVRWPIWRPGTCTAAR